MKVQIESSTDIFMSVDFRYSALSPVWSINVPTVLRNHLWNVNMKCSGSAGPFFFSCY